jgi:hypothetical protein
MPFFFVHRIKDSRVLPELVDRYIQRMTDDIIANNVDAADACDTQQRTLLTIAEGADANSRLSQIVRKMILFLELYRIKRGAPPAHKSKTCIVPLAEDYSDPNTILPEALKFMRYPKQFERELSVRKGLDERFVIDVIRYYDSRTDPLFAAAIKSFHNGAYAEYPYCQSTTASSFLVPIGASTRSSLTITSPVCPSAFLM